MTMAPWFVAPGNPATEHWLTRTGLRLVLVVVPHVTAGTRLADVLPLLEADYRVQVVFTVPPASDMWYGVDEYVRAWDGLVLPWHQVLRMRFDLILASSYRGIDSLTGPVLVLPHGISGRSRISPWGGDAAGRSSGWRDVLVRDGRVVPEAVALAHEQDARRLREDCPEAGSRAVVAGDVCFDRMQASRDFRRQYRRALGLTPGQKLVLVNSTWSPHSLLGSAEWSLGALVTQLPRDEYRVVAALHPLIWAMHGRWQVRSWLAGHDGLLLVPPEEGWRAALVAADYQVGDHGSVTGYGAALGTPTLLNPASGSDIRPGSPAAALWRLAPMIDANQPITAQFRELDATHSPQRWASLAARITSLPGRAGAVLRETMYRILGIPEPSHAVPVSAVPLPTVIRPASGPGGDE